jgi:hypothetical protein
VCAGGAEFIFENALFGQEFPDRMPRRGDARADRLARIIDGEPEIYTLAARWQDDAGHFRPLRPLQL